MQALHSLKRPRPSSPEPEVILSSPSPRHPAKRRRIVGPDAWDGSTRHLPHFANSEPEYDENPEEGEDNASDAESTAESSNGLDTHAHTEAARRLGEYRTINGFLHDLHAHNSRTSIVPFPHRYADHASKSQPVSQFFPTPKSFPKSAHQRQNFTSSLKITKAVTPLDEEQLVRQRYEETNRLLGSLVLGRRQALLSSYTTAPYKSSENNDRDSDDEEL